MTKKQVLPFILRFVVAAILIVAAIQKARNVSKTAASLIEFGVPKRYGLSFGRAMIATEISVAVLILIPITALVGLIMAIVLLGVFTTAVGVQLALGRRPSCGCFGDLGENRISRRTVLRNGAFIFLSIPPLVDSLNQNYPYWKSKSKRAAQISLWPLVTIANSLVLLRLLKQFGNIAKTLNDSRAKLAVGSVVADFEVLSVRTGAMTTLASMLSRENRMVLVFISPHCDFCHQVFPALAAYTGSHRPYVITSGLPETLVDAASQYPGVTFLADSASSAGIALMVTATPTAFLLDEFGALMEPPAEGAVEVVDLLQSID